MTRKTRMSFSQQPSLLLVHCVWVDIKSPSQEVVCPFVWEEIKEEVQ
jgi:hypothetical protein